MKVWSVLLAAIATTLGVFTAPAVNAQQPSDADYPKRPIRILVATPAGGGVDAITRLVAEKLRQRWGQTVIVENRTGAGGLIAAEALSTAEPDGYTLFTTHPGPLAATAMYKKINYDPSSLKAVVVMAIAPMVIAGRKDLPLNSIPELIAFAKENPGKLTAGSSGFGTISHLTVELLKHRAGINMGHVPYRGSAPATNDLAGGQFDIMGVDVGTVMPIYEAKRAKILGAAAPSRLPAIPDVPTFSEAGLPDFVTTTWYALVAPPQTPDSIRTKINGAVLEALRAPEAQAQLKALMVEPLIVDVTRTEAFIKSETTLWTDVIRAANVSVQ